jgi:hypothetical protein
VSATASTGETTLGTRGTRLPLFGIGLESACWESVLVHRLAFSVTGMDAGARLLLLVDLDGDGVAEDPGAIVAEAAVPGAGTQTVELNPEGLLVTQTETHFVAVLELSGEAPHNAEFSATFDPSATVAEGVRDGEASQLEGQTTTVASATSATTLLGEGETLTLSENPVRSGSLHLTFSEPPTLAAVYTVGGRRVADLAGRLTGGAEALEWDLTNDEGSRVAPGVYLLVIDVAGERYREKLMILPSASGGQEP